MRDPTQHVRNKSQLHVLQEQQSLKLIKNKKFPCGSPPTTDNVLVSVLSWRSDTQDENKIACVHQRWFHT